MARFVVDLRLYLERERENLTNVYIKLKNKEKHYSTFRGSKKGKAFSEIRCVLYKRAFQFSLIFTLAPLFFFFPVTGLCYLSETFWMSVSASGHNTQTVKSSVRRGEEGAKTSAEGKSEGPTRGNCVSVQSSVYFSDLMMLLLLIS